MIKERKANIIFAVTKGNHDLYSQVRVLPFLEYIIKQMM